MAMVGVAVLSGVIAGIVIPAYQNHQRQVLEAAAASEAEAAREAEKNKELRDIGSLKIWVPAGVVGDDYWVYLNGHIVSAPPHGIGDRTDDALLQHDEDGWLLSFYSVLEPPFIIRDGYFLKTDSFLRYIGRNLDSASGDARHLFYPVDLHLRSGKYIVEVAYLSKVGGARGSFPFSISPKYIANVQIHGIAQLYIGVPNNWMRDAFFGLADDLCGPFTENGKPSMEHFSQRLKNYVDDPVVRAMRALNVSVLSQSKGIVDLNLPPPQGSAREFDRSQITYIAKAILHSYEGPPSHEAIANCKESHPQFSQSYEELDKLVSDFESQLQFFHAVAGK